MTLESTSLTLTGWRSRVIPGLFLAQACLCAIGVGLSLYALLYPWDPLSAAPVLTLSATGIAFGVWLISFGYLSARHRDLFVVALSAWLAGRYFGAAANDAQTSPVFNSALALHAAAMAVSVLIYGLAFHRERKLLRPTAIDQPGSP